MRSALHIRSLTIALLLPCLLGAGCARVVKSLADISKLQAAIVKEFGEKDVNVNLSNGDTIFITFINSPLNDKGAEERAKRAEQTAALVKQSYPTDQVEEIWVAFIRSHTRFIVVSYSESLGFFGFDKTGRPLSEFSDTAPRSAPAPASVPDDSLRPIAVYSSTSNQTEITVTSLQLQGDVNAGMAVSPHFTVPGDASGVRRSSSYPRTVTFDFASYSEKSLFPGAPKIKLLADGKVVFETAEQFSTSKNGDGLFSEFLKLEVPYPAFRRLATATKVVISLAEHEYNLTDEQVKALRGMTDYVRE